MAMTLTVRRRAVCALALLALLCACCCPPACVAAAEKEVDVPVEVSCADAARKVSWRVPGESAWQKCAITVDESFTMSGAIYDENDSLCAWAGTQYDSATLPSGRCSAAAAQELLAFTLHCKTKESSGVYRRWLFVNKSPGAPATDPSGDTLGVLHSCNARAPGGGAPEEKPESPPTEVEPPAGPGEKPNGGNAEEGEKNNTAGGDVATVCMRTASLLLLVAALAAHGAW
ncbi:mucin-like glycoprotein [Trypanosoma conorhini]|uniref:Mucin-like glycoprotein n=1 Tax=Trypanosoma conorhini TaxID=83891 RepID=A0A422MQI2_9TRYP|nr:mucin-like glycoprotein [Trypanosoma conorhini]RNE95508.1 mucin-like glycoprotein [Trypanosoma conorhini]